MKVGRLKLSFSHFNFQSFAPTQWIINNSRPKPSTIPSCPQEIIHIAMKSPLPLLFHPQIQVSFSSQPPPVFQSPSLHFLKPIPETTNQSTQHPPDARRYFKQSEIVLYRQTPEVAAAAQQHIQPQPQPEPQPQPQSQPQSQPQTQSQPQPQQQQIISAA